MTTNQRCLSVRLTSGAHALSLLLSISSQALQDELERSRLELEQVVKEKDSTIAAKDKEISQVSILTMAFRTGLSVPTTMATGRKIGRIVTWRFFSSFLT